MLFLAPFFCYINSNVGINVLLKTPKKSVTSKEEPKLYRYLGHNKYGKDYLYYYITKLTEENGATICPTVSCLHCNFNILIEKSFQLFGFQSSDVVKNGVLKDLRNKYV
jgi:subfamily B ATP-binding cassette protein MsbA